MRRTWMYVPMYAQQYVHVSLFLVSRASRIVHRTISVWYAFACGRWNKLWCVAAALRVQSGGDRETGRHTETETETERQTDREAERDCRGRSKEGRHDDLLYHVILLLAPTTPSFKIRKQELREYVPLAYTQLSPGFVHCCGWVAGLQNSARGRRAPLFMIMIISLGTDVVPPAERCRTRRNRRPKDVCNR